MSEKLKFAVIGCGGILTWAHLPGYINIDNIEIVAFCDIVPEHAKTAAEKYAKEKGLDTVPPIYEDYKDVLDIPGLDAIDICTPNIFHSIIAVDALERGINVLCEKPDAVSVSEAEKSLLTVWQKSILKSSQRRTRRSFSLFLMVLFLTSNRLFLPDSRGKSDDKIQCIPS